MAKLKLEGFPKRKFYRYVLKHKHARTPEKIALFEFDKDGKAEIDEKDLYPFELKRVVKKYIEEPKLRKAREAEEERKAKAKEALKKEEEKKNDTPEKKAPKGSVGAKAKKD